MGSIFGWIEDQVMGLVSDMLKPINELVDLISTPINAIVEQVTGGIWKGDGATKFAEEMTSVVIPMIGGLFTIGNSWINAIKQGNDMMADAMRQATSAVDEVIDVFDSIF